MSQSENSAEHAASDDRIVKAAIYPPIGVCRVGNSPHEFYCGPEVPDPPPLPPCAYRDDQGRLKREAARFRVYGLNAAGQAVKELTTADTDIEWEVELANQKASWYEFQLAQDIPEAKDAPPSLLRNGTVSDRSLLNITPGKRCISGADQTGQQFDDGEFMGQKVYLGELRTDDAGRLIVLGGHGVSASSSGAPAITFANNSGWYDDTSDGPVHARVNYQGAQLEVEPAWVVCAPPNYGPQQKSVRTMWDVMRDVAIQNNMLAKPERPSFQNDIRPLFERLSSLQWVNQGFAAGFGFRAPFEFSTEPWLTRLNDPTPANEELRRVLTNNFRHPDVDAWSPVPWAWVYGDAMNVPAAHTPRQYMLFTDYQVWALEQWTIGNFDADYDPCQQPPRTIEAAPVAAQPELLTQAAMEFCLADAFHPGCEMTWPMRQAGMYSSAFRIKHRRPNNPEPPYGSQLADIWNLEDGPIKGGQTPGSITRWMAIPWQTDTASCRSGYDTKYDPYLPTFWPARVPNEVLSETAYKTVMNEALPLSQRLQAFAERANWLEPLGLEESYTHQINYMIHHFGEMGVVEVRPGLPDDPNFPDVMQVSDRQATPETKDDLGLQAARLTDAATSAAEQAAPQPTNLKHIEKVRRFPRGISPAQ